MMGGLVQASGASVKRAPAGGGRDQVIAQPGFRRTRRRLGKQSGGASAHRAAERARNPDEVDVATSH
jgi:hypothetical protein